MESDGGDRYSANYWWEYWWWWWYWFCDIVIVYLLLMAIVLVITVLLCDVDAAILLYPDIEADDAMEVMIVGGDAHWYSVMIYWWNCWC